VAVKVKRAAANELQVDDVEANSPVDEIGENNNGKSSIHRRAHASEIIPVARL
jgi:hypothetical protein